MRFTRLAAAGAALLFAAAAYSQTLPPGVTKGASLEGITEYQFPNGLRVLLFPDQSNPKATVNMTVLVGSRHEGYGETGMAHLLEHLLFMRTTTGREIKKELTGHGAVWNGSTNYDRTNYFETFTATDENLRWALSLEADRLVNSVMDKALLDTEMTVVRNEFEMGENQPARVLMERVTATAYLWHNYGKSTIGARADIENVPIDRLAAFYRKYYQPDNAVLVVAGKFDEARALAIVAGTAGAIPRPARKLETTYTVEPTQDGERYVALRRVGDGQSVMAAYHTPAAAHPDTAALEVLAGIMSGGGGGRGGAAGGGGTGRLSKALVDNKKAVSARMASEQLHDPGFVMVSAQLSKEQSLEEARKIMIDTVEGFYKEPPTQEEVDRAKTRLLRAMENRMTDSQSVGLGLSEWSAMGDWRLMFAMRDRIKAVTTADVVRVAKTYFISSNRTIGEFIPTNKPERAEVPATPDLTAMLKDFKSSEKMSQGEAFDPTPTAIEARLKRFQLASGLKVVLLPRQTRGGTVTCLLELHFGDAQSLTGKNAAAQIAGALLMRGTKTKTRQQIQDAMDKLNARIMISAGGGMGLGGGRRGGPQLTSEVGGVIASVTTTADNLEGALRLTVEILREPTFPDADFDQVRQQLAAAVEANRSEPQSLAALELQRHLSPYANGDPRYVATIDERIAELNKVTLAEVKQFHQQFYGASNGELVLSGQFDEAAARKLTAELLGTWKSAAPYQRLVTIYKAVAPVNRKIETPDKQNALFQAGMQVKMNDADPAYPALLLANSMFGGSLGARMPDRIRNKEGLSYSVRSAFTAPSQGEGASFSAMAISAPQNTPKVESCFLDELKKALGGGFTAGEVDEARKAYLDQQVVMRSQESTLVQLIAARERNGRKLTWDAEMEAKIKALTPDDINAAFRKAVDPAFLSIVKAGDFATAGAFK